MVARRQFDGIGILLLGLCALLATLVALAWGVRPPPVAEDIDAQTSMAWAAWAMVAVSAVSLIVGAVSLFLIFETLAAARRSADAADKAVQASQDAITATRETGKAQVRAYVMISDVVLAWNLAGNYTIDVSYLNSGQTPAHGVWAQCRVFVGPDEDGKQALVDEGTESRADIAAGGSGAFDLESSIAFNRVLELLEVNEIVDFTIEAELNYDDVFGDNQNAKVTYTGFGRRGSYAIELFKEIE